MQMLFLDESAPVPNPKKTPQRYFVIGGVIIPEGAWHSVEASLSKIKRHFNIDGEIKWRYFSPHNNDPDNPLLHLTQDEKNKVRQHIYQIVTTRKAIRILAAVASIQSAVAAGIDTADLLFHRTYKTLTERFQYYLQDLSRNIGSTELGIIICDNRTSKDDQRLRELHQTLLTSNKPYVSRYNHLIEGVFIAPSHHSVGIQLADLVAGAVWRAFEHNDPVWFNLIKGSFRRGPNGEIEGYGLVKVPKTNWR